ncbi:MAG: matrixin family metalloprotease [Actinomycetota bacterium]|nr:matrixin family metalloprotease [Actinomycetota bacterium]
MAFAAVLAAVGVVGLQAPSTSHPDVVLAAVLDRHGAEPSGGVSIFADEPALNNSGWASCPDPIAWNVDTSGLSKAAAARQLANLRWALAQWNRASGLEFRYAGEAALVYDESTFSLTRADGYVPPERHIYLSFIADGSSRLLGGATVGQGGPSAVIAAAREIVTANAVFRIDHVVRASTRAVRSLYLHELGHALGLAHLRSSRSVMYPTVTDQVRLGAGDIKGVRSLTKPCP